MAPIVIDPEKIDRHKWAEMLHARECKYNHIDGCAFYYRTWDNDVYGTRARWLKRVDSFLAELAEMVAHQ